MVKKSKAAKAPVPLPKDPNQTGSQGASPPAGAGTSGGPSGEKKPDAPSVWGPKGKKGKARGFISQGTGETGESKGLGAGPWCLTPTDLAQLESFLGHISCMVVGITVEGATLFEDVRDTTWAFQPQGSGTILLSGRFRELNQILRSGIPQITGRTCAVLIPERQTTSYEAAL
ncbi:MAG: hypothetical protein ACK56I_17600, partial [bacterium]